MSVEGVGLRRAASVALAVYVVFLAVILLNPSAGIPSDSVVWATAIGERIHLPGRLLVDGRPEFALNALIMVPLPVLGSLIWPRLNWRDWTAYGFVISAGVELFQGLLLPARSATFVDVVANTLGAGAGAIVVLALRRLRQAERRSV